MGRSFLVPAMQLKATPAWRGVACQARPEHRLHLQPRPLCRCQATPDTPKAYCLRGVNADIAPLSGRRFLLHSACNPCASLRYETSGVREGHSIVVTNHIL